MDNTFILNPSIDDLDLQDAIDERLTKIEAVINCLMATSDSFAEPGHKTIYNLIWLVDDYIDEIHLLWQKLLQQQQSLSRR